MLQSGAQIILFSDRTFDCVNNQHRLKEETPVASAVISFVVRPRVKVMTRLQNGAAAVLCEGEGGGELYNFTKLQSTAW